MTVLQIENLSLAINGSAILSDVSLSVNPSEVLAITGESGSGKSMTAFAMMQLLPQGAQTSGLINLSGENLLACSEAEMCKKRGTDVAMVFQEPMTALNPVHTIGAQVTEAIAMHSGLSVSQSTQRAVDLLARVGLPVDRFPLTRFPHELSGGQRQRVVIAMAIARGPKLLIADEPTTALDVTTQAQILDLLVKLTKEDGMALVLITHDLAVVAQCADQIAVMRRGEIVEAGATETLLRTRKHPYTRMLFKASTHQVDLPQAPVAEPLLKAHKVTRHYRLPRKTLFRAPGVFEAVKDVSFTISKGERLGLVGESGCGKSTLTRALLGLEPLQSGTVEIAGDLAYQDAASTRAARQRMQVVFQDPFGSFNPRHTVARLIAEPFHLMPKPPTGVARAAAISQALIDVGLSPQDASRYIHEFSGGQRQRIAIARALITNPELIILDEAVSALDVSVRAQILDLLAQLCRSHGLTYLFISHDLSVVRSVTDRVLVMRAGEVVEHGPTQDVFTNPKHSYTKRLVKAAPTLPDFTVKEPNAPNG